MPEPENDYILSNKCPLTNCTFKGVTKGLTTLKFGTLSRIINGEVFYENDSVAHCPEPCRWLLKEGIKYET